MKWLWPGFIVKITAIASVIVAIMYLSANPNPNPNPNPDPNWNYCQGSGTIGNNITKYNLLQYSQKQETK